MGIDFNRSRQTWHRQIARWGGGENNGFIIRGGVKRSATIAMGSYTPQQRASLQIDNVVRLMISALNVQADGVPDVNRDTIQFAGKIYKMALPPQNPMPDGTFIAFDTPCLEIGAA